MREPLESIRDPGRKQRFVTAMFDTIAPRYDDFTRIFSFGMDARWKQYITARLAEMDVRDGACLDLACGTGDLSFALQKMYPGRTVVGLDASSRMIEGAAARTAKRVDSSQPDLRGRAHAKAGEPYFLVGDIMNLPVAHKAASVVTAGYAFRNVPDFRSALRKLAAILPNDAVLVTLDFYLPRSALWRALYLGYLRVAGYIVGWLWHREPEVYEYISLSIAGFVTQQGFTAELQSAGFAVEHHRSWLLGGIACHFARRVT